MPLHGALLFVGPKGPGTTPEKVQDLMESLEAGFFMKAVGELVAALVAALSVELAPEELALIAGIIGAIAYFLGPEWFFKNMNNMFFQFGMKAIGAIWDAIQNFWATATPKIKESWRRLYESFYWLRYGSLPEG